MLEAVLVIDAALRRCAGRLSAMQFDTGPRKALPPDAPRIWRDWIGAAPRTLASGQTELPSQPDPENAEALRRVAGQIDLIAGAMERLGR